MATLNVIYKIAADISGLQSGVNRAADSVERLEGIAGNVGRAMAGAFTITAVVGFVRETLDAADALQKLSDRTGIGTDALQQLDAIAQASGNTMEEVANAVNQMQKRIATDGKSTIQAIEEIGLSVADLKKLSPEDQFVAIAKGIQAIKDPAEQTRIAMELFGKSGAQLLPTLKADVDELKNSVIVMSKENVKALDDAGDALARFWKNMKNAVGNLGGELIRASKAWDEFWLNLQSGGSLDARITELKMLSQAGSNVPKLPQIASIPSSPVSSEEAGKLLTSGLKEQLQASKDSEEAFRKAQIELEKYRDALSNVTAFTDGFGTVLDTVDGQVLAGIRYYAERGKSVSDLGTVYGLTKQQVSALSDQLKFERSVIDATTKSFGGYNRQIQIALPNITGITEEMTRLSAGFDDEARAAAVDTAELEKQARTRKALMDAVTNQNIPLPGGKSGRQFDVVPELSKFRQRVQQAFDGVADILNNISGKWAEFGAIVARTGSAILSNLKSGNVFGAVVAGVAGVASAIGKLFKNTEKEVNPVRQAFVDAAGGLDVLNKRAHDAGVTLNHLLDARTPEAYKKAIDELNAAFEFQDQAMQTLDETVKKYGFTFEELGPALQRQNLDKQAQQLYQDFKVLTSAGIDNGLVIAKMGQSINDYVSEARHAGVEVPSAMQAMIQKAIELGQITDDNGMVIHNMAGAGITFSETMTQGFQKIVDAVQKLTDAITRGLGLAIQNIPDPVITGKVKWDVESIPTPGAPTQDFPGPRMPDSQIPAMASGGIVTQPTVALIGEAGPEAIVPLGSGPTKAGISVGSITVKIYAAPGDDPKALSEKFQKALRTEADLYAAIGNVRAA